MAQEIERYQGIEVQQRFVPKSEDRLWAYCVMRFKQRWAGKQRAIPAGVRSDSGDFGWWFPEVWVADYVDSHGVTLQVPRRQRPEADRVAYSERATATFGKRYSGQISTREAESWALPAGAVVSPDGVTYPDGSFETIADVRLRKGVYRPGQGNRNAAQQNLEDMLRVLHGRKPAEGGVTEELAANPLTKRDWNPTEREAAA
jgi:hypothetical protein